MVENRISGGGAKIGKNPSGSRGIPRQPCPHWLFANGRLEFGALPRLMGIVNVTPDSFSDGGQFFEHGMAVDHALRLAADGADILDVGGESTRPHSLPVAPEEELRRVVEVVRGIVRQTNVPVSIDTTKAAVARAALDAGAVIVNDISGLTFDPEMIEVCRSGNAGVVCMHIQGTPLTMQDNPQYADVAREVCECLAERLRSLIAAGIDVERIVLDPGVGFGKTAAHNLALLSNIARLKALGRPVLVGHSRKGFLKKIVGRDVDERSAGTLAVSLALAAQGVDLLRVHDVRATRDALAAWHAVQTAGDG